MSALRVALVLAALVVCANADWFNFGTYAEDFEPAPGFVLTTRNDAAEMNRGMRFGLLQQSTVIVVKVGEDVEDLMEGQTVFPTIQIPINAMGEATMDTTAVVDSRAYCPQPMNFNPEFIRSPTAMNGMPASPFSTIEVKDTEARGRYCLYHESQIAAVINNQAQGGSVGSSQVFNSFGFVPNVAGTARPTL
jgi:hypothetical protein